MKKFIRQYRTTLALSALLFTVALLLAISHNPLPFALWTPQPSPRLPVNVIAAPLSFINKPIQIARTGSIESSAAVPINAEYSGQLSEIYVTEGQTIKAGQPLLKLQVSSIPTANQNTGVSPQAQVNYDNLLKEVNRYQKLYEVGAIPRRQLEIATTRCRKQQKA